MTEADRVAVLLQSLANPLSALLAETQLLLLGDVDIDDEARHGLQEIEKLALRMRTILRETHNAGAPPVS